jgi:hypothetical protein
VEEGFYRNQFETGVSSGSLSAFKGGDRDLWEERLFGGAYHVPEIRVADRPKYGALELIRHSDGAAPRFGSCHFTLRAGVSKRCSFTFGGSQDPAALEQSGTLACIESVISALLTKVEKGQGALGIKDLTVSRLLEYLLSELTKPSPDTSASPLGRCLDSFIEAQVHGVVDLHRDVERLVADPAFRDTTTGTLLEAICSKYQIPLAWHPGFILPVSQIPDDFRGPAMPVLARRIAGDGILNVAMIGQAAASLNRQPELWRD